MSRVRRRAALLLLLPLLLPALDARAQPNSELTLDVQLIGAQSPTGQFSQHGYLRVAVENPAGSPISYDLRISSGDGFYALHEQQAEALSTRVHNIPLPLVGRHYTRVTLADEYNRVANGGAGGGNNEKIFLHIAPLADWAGEQQCQDFTSVFQGGHQGTGSSARTNIVSQLEPDRLPANWLCYAPFQAVFVEQGLFRRLPQAQSRALLEWVHGGGRLVLYGADALETENRLLGTVERRVENPLKTGEVLNRWRLPPSPWRGLGRGSDRDRLDRFAYAAESTGGRVGGLVLATLFFLVAGPANFLYWQRRRRIKMLLLTVPAMSVAFCLLIVVYFLVAEGFTSKGGTLSVSLLDEATASGFSHNRHAMLSGLYPLDGFHFRPETAFLPLHVEKDKFFSFDLTRDQHLMSGLFVPSINFHYYSALPWQSREKVQWDPAEGSLRNGFEQEVALLVLQDGDRFFLARQIGPGEQARVEPVQGRYLKAIFLTHALLDVEEEESLAELDAILQPLLETPAPGRPRYLALFNAPSPWRESGAPIRDGRARHILCGLVAPE